MNGVEQATLQEILDSNKEQEETLKAIAKALGATASKKAAKTEAEQIIENAGTAVKDLAEEFKFIGGILGGVFNLAAGAATLALGGLVQTGKALWANQMALSEGAIAGTNSLSSLTAGFESLPFGLGLVARAMTYQTKVLEQNLKTYQDISQVGATFGGSLDAARESAKSMGLNMDEFARTMKNNAPYLLSFGSTADEGAANLVKFNKQFVMGKDGLGRQLLGMGFTIEEANNALGLYAGAMGGVSRDQMQDQQKMGESVVAFATELQLSAELEGKSRKQAEEELKAKQANAVRENMLARMTETERQEFFTAENRARLMYGKDGENAVLATYAKMPSLLDKGGQTVMALAGNDIKAMTDNIGGPAEEHGKRMSGINKAAADGLMHQQEFVKNNRTLAMATANTNSALSGVMQAGLKNEAVSINQKLTSSADHLKRITDSEAKIEAAKKSEAANTAQAQARAKFSGDLMDMLAKILQPFFPIIQGLIAVVEKFAPVIAGFASGLVTLLTRLFTNIFGEIKLGDVMAGITAVGKTLYNSFLTLSSFIIVDIIPPLMDIVNFVKPAFQVLGDYLTGTVAPALSEMATFVADNLVPILGGAAVGLTTYGIIMGGIAAVQLADSVMLHAWYYGSLAKQMVLDTARNIMTIASTGGLAGLASAAWATAAPFLALAAPVIAVVAAVALVVAGFVALYKTGWTFGSALEAVGDNLKSFFILLQEGFLSVLDTVTFGDANKTVKARQAELAIEKEALAKREAARDAERAIKTKERSSEGKEEKRAEVKAELRKTLTPGSKEPARPEAKTEASSETAKTESTPTVAGEAPKKSSVAGAESATAKSKDPIEILRAEIKTLNTQLESMTRFMRDAADNTGKTASILASKGNLFK